MYCPKCGTENPNGAQLCQACSWVLTGTSITAENPNAKTSGLAIAALVLAILSLFTFFLTMIPAMICGIVSLVKIEKSGGQLKGKGLAITGIAVAAVLLPFIALSMGMLMPTLARVRQVAHRMACGTNMSALGKAMLVYASDNNDMFPTPSKWCDSLVEHCDMTEKSFRCKGASEGRCNYAMNKNIEKSGPAAPPDMVLLFDGLPGWNQYGGPDLTADNHDGEGCNVLFVDGHVEFVKTEDINDLRWTAEEDK